MQKGLHSLAKCLVQEIGVVDLDNTLIFLEQALFPWTTVLLHTPDVETQRPDRGISKKMFLVG